MRTFFRSIRFEEFAGSYFPYMMNIFPVELSPSKTSCSRHLETFVYSRTKNQKTKNLLNGVVSGIGGYGNCIGIPTVAGETKFNSTYNENILAKLLNGGVGDHDSDTTYSPSSSRPGTPPPHI